jgi:hypothetical protein
MESIKVNTRRQDQTIHHVVLNDEQLKALVLEAVARAAGVTIDRRAVRVDQLYLSSNMGSTGTEYRATCTITVDHQAQPGEPVDPGKAE